MVRITLRVLSALVLLGIVFVPFVASAQPATHEEVDSGNYHFKIGWLSEPVIVGERNGLELFVAKKDTPDEGLADITTLQFAVEYGGVSHTYEIVPAEDEPGAYTATFLPTREGQYTFHLTGKINDEAIDVSVEPEEVVAAGELAFPEAPTSTKDLETKLATAQAQTQTAQTLAIVGVVLGVIGTGLGVYGIMKKK
jgi:hypothetical protein